MATILEIENGTVKLKAYAIRDKQGQWFTASNRRGSSWSADLVSAKKWFKIGPARAAVTKIFNHDKLMPDLVEFDLTGCLLLDEGLRREQAAEKIKLRKNKRLEIEKMLDRKRDEAEYERLRKKLNK